MPAAAACLPACLPAAACCLPAACLLLLPAAAAAAAAAACRLPLPGLAGWLAGLTAGR